MRVPFVDLKIQYQSLKKDIAKAVEEVCEASSFILGPQVSSFERAFAEYTGSEFCIGVSNGTDAISLALKALGIGLGDEVIIPSHTFVATAIGVMETGATPVLVDIDPNTYLLNLNATRSAITLRTRAICPVHLYGRACNMTDLTEIAKADSLHIIEDAAQSHGAKWAGRRTGSFGACGSFSFYPGKNLGAYGDGGAIVTSSQELNKKLRAIRNYGSEVKYEHPMRGGNYRLDSIQASILNIKLKHLDSWNASRWKAASQYDAQLKELRGHGIVVPDLCTHNEHVFHLYVIQCDRRDELIEHLKANGIDCGIHYPIPFYLQGGYQSLGYKTGAFPVTEAISKKILSLPMFPELSPAQISFVCEKISDFVRK